MKNILLIILTLCSLPVWAQRNFEYRASLSGFASTRNTLPMWATANKHGLIPDNRGGLLQAGIFSGFNTRHAFQFAFGASAAGYLTEGKNNIFADEIYFSARWRKLHLDLGIIHPTEEFNGISAQNGNIIVSGNTRSLPGYNISTDYIYVPLTGKVLAFKANYSDYVMIDKRYVKNTRLHNKSFFIRITPWHRLDLIAGLGHWAQWAGDSPSLGKQPGSFRDYIRVITGRSGGEGASLSDSINALGNHLGRRYLRINYRAETFTLTAYYDNLFEDGAPDHLRSLPDGTYGIYYGNTRQCPWISDMMYELTYTKYQSGPHHDRPATPEEKAKQDPHSYFYGKTILGGNDNDFNNGEYQSGWTYYGRTIGTPFITPKAAGEDGITLGVFNNRVIAHYVGVKGYICHKLPYTLRLSYSLNYGTYSDPLPERARQCSFGIEAGILRKANIPFQLDLGVYGDYGKLYDNNFGLTVTLSRNGLIK